MANVRFIFRKSRHNVRLSIYKWPALLVTVLFILQLVMGSGLSYTLISMAFLLVFLWVYKKIK